MDGDNRFVDFMQDGGGEMPFAIECVGNEFVIGKSALDSATQKLAPNAFANIFDALRNRGLFDSRDVMNNSINYHSMPSSIISIKYCKIVFME